MECGRRADHDPGMFGRRKSVCALQRILSAGLVYKKDRIQPETNAGTSHDLVLSRDRLQAGWPKEDDIRRRISVEEAWQGAQNLVTEQTPRTFIWHTNTDGTVPAENTLLFAQALLRHGVDSECHMYHRGCHGLSLANEQTKVRGEHLNPHVAGWFDTAFEWLEE